MGSFPKQIAAWHDRSRGVAAMYEVEWGFTIQPFEGQTRDLAHMKEVSSIAQQQDSNGMLTWKVITGGAFLEKFIYLHYVAICQ